MDCISCRNFFNSSRNFVELINVSNNENISKKICHSCTDDIITKKCIKCFRGILRPYQIIYVDLKNKVYNCCKCHFHKLGGPSVPMYP